MSFNKAHCYGEFNSTEDYGLNDLIEDLEAITGEEVTIAEINLHHQMMTGTDYPACTI